MYKEKISKEMLEKLVSQLNHDFGDHWFPMGFFKAKVKKFDTGYNLLINIGSRDLQLDQNFRCVGAGSKIPDEWVIERTSKSIREAMGELSDDDISLNFNPRQVSKWGQNIQWEKGGLTHLIGAKPSELSAHEIARRVLRKSKGNREIVTASIRKLIAISNLSKHNNPKLSKKFAFAAHLISRDRKPPKSNPQSPIGSFRDRKPLKSNPQSPIGSFRDRKPIKSNSQSLLGNPVAPLGNSDVEQFILWLEGYGLTREADAFQTMYRMFFFRNEDYKIHDAENFHDYLERHSLPAMAKEFQRLYEIYREGVGE